jgi:hypothetical protein
MIKYKIFCWDKSNGTHYILNFNIYYKHHRQLQRIRVENTDSLIDNLKSQTSQSNKMEGKEGAVRWAVNFEEWKPIEEDWENALSLIEVEEQERIGR